MYKVTIRGDVDAPKAEWEQIVYYADCQDDFVGYIDELPKDLFKENEFSEHTIGSYMKFFIENDQLYVRNEYFVNQKLNEFQLRILESYTEGRWSDGIGEGFEQFPYYEEDDKEYYVSPWHYTQKLIIK